MPNSNPAAFSGEEVALIGAMLSLMDLLTLPESFVLAKALNATTGETQSVLMMANRVRPEFSIFLALYLGDENGKINRTNPRALTNQALIQRFLNVLATSLADESSLDFTSFNSN